MVIFQYNLYIFVWIQHGCLTSTIFAMDPNNSVIKRLRCTYVVHEESPHNPLLESTSECYIQAQAITTRVSTKAMFIKRQTCTFTIFACL